MRVIAGSAGGIPLQAPRWDGVRPTMDQVRAAIFSSLAARVPDARVLDLFAGTGALGIEALSRGAMAATFVERDRRAIDCLRRNLEQTHLADRAQTVCLDVFGYLERAAAQPAHPRFDLILADPPYTSTDQPVDYSLRLLGSPALASLLAEDGIFILEKSPRQLLPDTVSGWELQRRKRYGATEVVFCARPITEAAPAPPEIPAS